jgi:hypothetical protein
MTTRRHFVCLLSLTPLAGVSLLAACGEKAPPAASAPSPGPAPAQPVAPPVAATPAPAVAAAPAATPTPTPAPTVVAPDEQLATSLGYVTDATEVDPSKYPAFVAGRNCSQCALYSGAAGEAKGPCSIFNGRLVNAQGWCGVWAKRA